MPVSDPIDQDVELQDCDYLVPNSVWAGRFAPNFAFVCVTGVPQSVENGIRSLRFGIEYDDLMWLSWASCTGGDDVYQDDADGRWPSSGTWYEARWPDDCYQVTDNDIGATRAGYLVVNPGQLDLIRFFGHSSDDGEIRATDCEGAVTSICPDAWGVGHVDSKNGGTKGINTCGAGCASPVLESTWSTIKSAYR